MSGQAAYERRFGGSPPFSKRNTATLAQNAVLNIHYSGDNPADFPYAQKFAPLDYAFIRHSSTAGQDSAVEIYVNGDFAAPVHVLLPGASIKIDEEFLPGGFSSLHLKNIGATTIAAKDLLITAQKLPLKEIELIRQQHRRQFGVG